jgi:IclR family acetate operon transcriptional repressor
MSDAPAIRRAISVLELLGSSQRGYTLSELGRKLDLPKSSTHRILHTLEEEACVHKNADTGRYGLGMRITGLRNASMEGTALRETASRHLMRLMQRTRLTVHMVVLEQGQAVIIAKLEPPGEPSVGTWVGRAMDVNSTASGKALIAYLSPQELTKEIKSASAFVRHNHKTIVTMTKLKAELAKVRELGYSMDDEEDELDTRCVGAPIFDKFGKVVAAISVVGHTERIRISQIDLLANQVKQTATAISRSLGAEAMRAE